MRALGAVRMLGVLLWSLLWITLAMVWTALSFKREASLVIARRIWAPGVLRLAGARLILHPLPDVNWSAPHIFVMNHQSMLDIPVAFAAVPVNLHFVAKHSLKWIPFLGWYMWLTGMVFVDRRARKQSVNSLQAAVLRVQRGTNLIVFPEGTRSSSGQLQPFKRGAIVLALQSQVPVIPMAVVGTGERLPAGGFALRPGEVRLKIGEPMTTEGKTVDERATFAAEVQAQVARLSGEVWAAGAPPER